MWSFKNYLGFLTYVCFYTTVSLARIHCHRQYTNYAFNQSNSDQSVPGKLHISHEPRPGEPVYGLQVVNRTEDMNLTVFAIPFVKHASECPGSLTGEEDIRQYETTCTFIAGEDETEQIFVSKIFTGCYYFIMTNSRGRNWVWTNFGDTSYPFPDIKLKLKQKNTEIVPEDLNRPMQLRHQLKIPLACIQVQAQLFEFKREIKNTKKCISHIGVPPSQECWFSETDKGKSKSCKMSHLITNLSLEVHVDDDTNDGWTATIIWKELRYGGGSYYLSFAPSTTVCQLGKYYSYSALHEWRPLDREICIDLGQLYETNLAREPVTTNFLRDPTFNLILYILLGATVTTFFAYWTWKIHILWRKRRSSRDEVPELPIIKEYGKESDAVMLMYVGGCPVFMSVVRSLRNHLENVNCRVHDVYADDGEYNVADLGVTQWVDYLLTEGCRVVWIDTPQLRSRLKDQQKQYFGNRFQDEALPYAFNVATESFQNSTTQYLRHYVLRVTGFEVDDLEKDPLSLVSTFVRYLYPNTLDALCDDLKVTDKWRSKSIKPHTVDKNHEELI